MDVPRVEPNAGSDRIAAIRDAMRFCTDAELAVALSLSVRTIHRYVARVLPVMKFGRRQYFEPAAVSAWLLENCHSAKAARVQPQSEHHSVNEPITPDMPKAA
jgi:hypothetical protein